MQPPVDPEVLGSIDALLDEALHDVVAPPPDLHAEAQARRQRTQGTVLMVIAVGCIASLGLLAGHLGPVGILLVCAAALVLLSAGAWLIDRAGKDEMRRRTWSQDGADCDVLGAALDIVTLATARRRRHFGLGMLVLACFSICVFSARLPGGGAIDSLMWGGFSIALICVGAWHVGKAANEHTRAQVIRDAALHRKAAEARAHIRRIG